MTYDWLLFSRNLYPSNIMIQMKSFPFLLLLTLATPNISPIYAQNPPAETYQPGFWQPVNRFDIQRTVEVKIINNTDILIEYDLTDLEAIKPQSLQPEQTGMLTGFGNSAYIVIYPLVKSTNDFNLRFEVTINEEDNIVNVSVLKAKKSDFIGHRSVNLQKTGAIYLY